MTTLPCLSIVLDKRGGCRVHGEHLADCRGVQVDGGRLTECTGCLPQPATRGLLCESCWQRFTAALDQAVDHITHMRSVERGPVPDGPKVQSGGPGPRVILPVSWIAADETWAALCDLAALVDPVELLAIRPGGTTAYGFGSRDSIEHVRDRVQLAVDIVRASGEGVARNDRTARAAIRFYRQAQVVRRQFPVDEDSHRIAYARCRHCKHMTLERKPPLQHLDPITVKCLNPACGRVWDPAIVEVDLASIRHDLEEAAA